MSFARRPRYELPLEKDRLVHRHIVVLITHRKNVIVKNHIAFMDVIPKIIDDVFANRPERKGKYRQVLRLLEHVARTIVKPGYEILGFT